MTALAHTEKVIGSIVPLPEQIERQLGSVMEAVKEGNCEHAVVLLKAIAKYMSRGG